MPTKKLYVNNLTAVPDDWIKLFDIVAEKEGRPNYGRPNCNMCKNQGFIPGSAHSKCLWFRNNIREAKMNIEAYELMIAGSIMVGMVTDIPAANLGDGQLPMVGLHRTGLKGGWAYWPIDFDPVWILWCIGFDPKE